MSRRIKLETHLSLAELEQRYREAEAPVARSHFQIVWLLAQGQTARQVAETTAYSPYWIGQVARRYNAGGPEALGDQRRHHPGGVWLLSDEQKAALEQALEQSPPDGGLWNSRKVAEWMAEATGRAVSPQRGWDYLHLLGYTPQVPRPRHYKADPEAQEGFKKNSARVRR